MTDRSAVLMRCLVAALIMTLTVGAQTVVRAHTGGADNDRLGSAIAGGVFGALDATADVAVGSPGHDGGGGPGSGRVDVFDGSSGTILFSVTGSAGSSLGSAVALGGDLDGDVERDVLVGAPGSDLGLGVSQGQAVAYSSSTGLLLWTVNGTAAGDETGAAVAIIGDADGDTFPDVAVGSPGYDGVAGADCGRVTIHSGITGTLLLTAEGTVAGARFGASLAALGDTDGDGIEDLAVGSPNHAGLAGADSGRAVVLETIGATELRSVEGTAAGELFGTAVGNGGDLDNDGRADMAAGGPGFDGSAGLGSGRVRVISGRDGSALLTVEGSAAGAQLGSSVGGGGDVDLDGFDDLICGAPGYDGVAGVDCGLARVLSGADGGTLFQREGASAGDAEGSAVAGLGDLRGNNRLEVASGAPQRAGGGVDRGEATILAGAANASSSVTSYGTDSQPRATALADVDSDGDNDVVVLNSGSVSVFWNGDQAGSTPFADLSQVARLDVPLSGGAVGVSLVVGDLDGDTAPEVVVGRSDGTVDILDGSGNGSLTALALTATSPVTADTSTTPGAIQGVAILEPGVTGSIVCAGVGSFITSGFLNRITDPMVAPTVTAPLISGGAFQAVVVGDVDGDLVDDVVAANGSSGSAGGIHILDGANGLPPFVGSPYSAGAVPSDVTLADLDGDGVTDDVVIASIDFFGGGVRVLQDFTAALGFAGTVDPGLVLARAVQRANLDAVAGDDIAVLDGAGDLVHLTGWSGAAFSTQTTHATTVGAGVQLTTGNLTLAASPPLCDTDEVVTAHLSSDLINVWRNRRVFSVTDVANTGCPIGAPTAVVSFSNDPVINSTGLTIDVTGASPLSMAVLGAQALPSGGSVTVDTTSGCGVAMTGSTFVQFLTFTDAVGNAFIPAGIPHDPCLIGEQFVLQWGVLDGGPYLGFFTTSDAIIVSVGEN